MAKWIKYPEERDSTCCHACDSKKLRRFVTKANITKVICLKCKATYSTKG